MADISFSEESINQQLIDLGEIIGLTIIVRLIKEKKLENQTDLTWEKFEEILNSISPNEIKDIFQEEAQKIIKEYFQKITETLSEEEKENFYRKILNL
jgi:methionyl-tRNA synthetase